jgi:hypothetical protein
MNTTRKLGDACGEKMTTIDDNDQSLTLAPVHRRISQFGHKLALAFGAFHAAGLLIGCANGILREHLGEEAAHAYFAALAAQLSGTIRAPAGMHK